MATVLFMLFGLSCDALSTVAAPSKLPAKVLQENLVRHQEAIRNAEQLFYGFDFTDQEWQQQKDAADNIQWTRYSFPGQSLEHELMEDAMPPVPFGMEDLARISQTPVLTDQECQLLMDEADNFGTYFGWKHGAARYGTSVDRAGLLMPLEDLSVSYTAVNFEILPRLFTCMSQTFACLGDDPRNLRLGGARVVKYEGNHVELGMHRDGLLLTVNIALNDPSEFTGGGTVVQALSQTQAVRLPKGHALIHPGDVLHCGMPITSGQRYVLVLFILSTAIVPHDRYCSERGERDLAMAKQLYTDNGESSSSLISSAREHFINAVLCGARTDEGALLSAMRGVSDF